MFPGAGIGEMLYEKIRKNSDCSVDPFRGPCRIGMAFCSAMDAYDRAAWRGCFLHLQPEQRNAADLWDRRNVGIYRRSDRR